MTWTITPDGLGQFVLVDDKGQVLRTGPNAKALSTWALDNGARSVRWDFDLKLAE